MSTDTHSPSVTGLRCEAVAIDTIPLPCLHSRLANMPHLEPADVGRGLSHRDDPAVLIGLALAFVRQGHLLDGLVPEPLIRRLSALADGGNPACRLLLDWLRNRNRDLAWVPNERLTRSAPVAASADIHLRRRSPRERVLAASKKSGYHDRRKHIRTRPRDPVRNPETAIIAAETGGRVDG
ncbi:hypothetical protein ACS4RR_022635 [Rhizobium sp. Z1P35]|uniref:hypothetical protein n=1 Tax=Rhizobium leguminosarum TaxID=384 RepID=UPI0015F96166|nr:hypothetical protein [Rhizobium leguminosarum]MBA8836343.1 hypothetical protein [Rhizobium leguminosarum]